MTFSVHLYEKSILLRKAKIISPNYLKGQNTHKTENLSAKNMAKTWVRINFRSCRTCLGPSAPIFQTFKL